MIAYDGVPQTIDDADLGGGFIHTDDGTLVAGQPDSAVVPGTRSTTTRWTRRRTRSEITVPRGLEAIANGVLTDVDHRGRWTTWEWEAREPMASYLTTATIGEFDVRSYRADGIRYWDAIDPDVFEPPRTAQRPASTRSLRSPSRPTSA